MEEQYTTPSQLPDLPLEYLPNVQIALVVYNGKTYKIPPSHLKGDQGDTGGQGIQGIQGDQGNQGIQGDQGDQGIKGDQGDQGNTYYPYVAWASDAAGSDFSLTPSPSLKFRAEIHSTVVLDPPAEANFNGADWVKQIYSSNNIFNEIPNGSIDGVNKDFGLSRAIAAGDSRVYLGGVRQKLGSAYTEGAAQVSFAEAPNPGAEIIVDIVSDENTKSNQTPTGVIDGVNTDFTLADTPTETEVYLGGSRQTKGTHYTVSGDVITFINAPYAGEEIIVDYKY